jgi:hypothetical protein
MIEPLRPEIESAQTETTAGSGNKAAPQNRDVGRINFAIRPANRAFPERGTTPAPDLAAPLKDPSVTRPRTETARIRVLSDSAKIPGVFPGPALNQKAAGNQRVIDTIPKPICWVLLGSSIAILLIEIWNYIS